MLEFALDIVGFLLKTAIIIGLISLPIVLGINLLMQAKKEQVDPKKGSLVIEDLKQQSKKRKDFMTKSLKKTNPDKSLHKQELKVGLAKEEKESKKEQKSQAKDKVSAKLKERNEFKEKLTALEGEGVFCPQNLFVIDFIGSTKGQEVKDLRRKIDAILEVATEQDEVIINLTSPGGLVNSYGLCASQLQRIRDRNIKLTVTVDEVAASGGYLMACVAHKIVAAPFSYIGSIGVIAGIPNFRKVLNKYDVDYEQITAGKYKRTLSVLGENTEEGRKKFKEELEAVHARFKEQVLRYRPHLDADKVATGEHWLAIDAKELGLVDEIATSDEYIKERIAHTRDCALKIKWQKAEKKNIIQKLFPKEGITLKGFSLSKQATKEVEELEQNSFLNLK